MPPSPRVERKQKRQKQEPTAEETPAGPSAPTDPPKIVESKPSQPATEAAPASGPAANIDFNVAGTTDEGSENAIARQAKRVQELEAESNDQYDKLVERDSRIDSLEKQVNALKSDLSKHRKEKDDLGREISSLKEAALNTKVAKEKIEKELKQQKGIADYDRERHEKLYKESVEDEKKMKLANAEIRNLKANVSEATATRKQLHERVDDLEAQVQTLQAANSNFALSQEGNKNEVSHATKEFEQMFKDIGSELDLNGYVSHVRNLLNTGHLKRQSSQLSLERQLSTQKSNQELRTAAGKSLQDQLAAVDDASSDRSIPRGGDPEDDEDDTITDLGLGRTFTEYDYFVRLQKQEQRIIELEQTNEELLNKPKETEAIHMTNGTTQTDVDESANKQKISELENINAELLSQINMINAVTTINGASQTDAVTTGYRATQTDADAPADAPTTPRSQNLGFSGIESVQTPPQAPEAITQLPIAVRPGRFSIRLFRSVETRPIRPPRVETAPRVIRLISTRESSILELWKYLPTTRKLFLIAMFFLYLILFAGAASERYIWTSANWELPRDHVVRMGGSGIISIFSPILMAVDTLVGVESGMLG